MSLRITGSGIEGDSDFEIKSLTGDVKFKDSVTDLPKKTKTKWVDGDIVVLYADEALVTPPLTFTGDSLLCLKPGSKLKIV